MAYDFFMKIEGIDGESADEQHKDQIEVESFSWGLSQTGSFSTGGGGGAGKVQFQDFHFSSASSKASPKLMLACATGEHIKEATLTVRRSNTDNGGTDFMFIKMNDVLISSFSQGGGGGGFPTETISLAFAKVNFTFIPQDLTGKLLSPVSAGWDLKANKKV